MSIAPSGNSSDNFPRTPVIIIGSVAGGLIILASEFTEPHPNQGSRTAGTWLTGTVAGGLLYLFSRKERARRRNAQQEEYSPIQPPPAYKMERASSTRTITPQPRPLSTFAPDYSRQAQYNHQYQQQLSRSSSEQPPPYPTIPTYDPSQYQPIRPTSMVVDMRAYANYSHPLNPHPGPSSRLSAVHYGDARLSTYPAAGQVPMALPYPVAPRPSANQDNREGRERSFSEPMLSGQPAETKGTKQPKPVLSRLITNFP